jgi:hypothetical protein
MPPRVNRAMCAALLGAQFLQAGPQAAVTLGRSSSGPRPAVEPSRPPRPHRTRHSRCRQSLRIHGPLRPHVPRQFVLILLPPICPPARVHACDGLLPECRCGALLRKVRVSKRSHQRAGSALRDRWQQSGSDGAQIVSTAGRQRRRGRPGCTALPGGVQCDSGPAEDFPGCPEQSAGGPRSRPTGGRDPSSGCWPTSPRPTSCVRGI